MVVSECSITGNGAKLSYCINVRDKSNSWEVEERFTWVRMETNKF